MGLNRVSSIPMEIHSRTFKHYITNFQGLPTDQNIGIFMRARGEVARFARLDCWWLKDATINCNSDGWFPSSIIFRVLFKHSARKPLIFKVFQGPCDNISNSNTFHCFKHWLRTLIKICLHCIIAVCGKNTMEYENNSRMTKNYVTLIMGSL